MDNRIIRRKLEILKSRSIMKTYPITSWEVRLAEYLSPEKYRYDGGWKKLDSDGMWGWDRTVFLRTGAKTPAGVKNNSLYISFDFERLEGMLSIDGIPYCGLDENHKRFHINKSGKLNLLAEFNSIPWALCMPQYRSEYSRFKSAQFEEIDSSFEKLYYDIRFAWEVSEVIKDQRRKELLSGAIESALLALDMTLPCEKLKNEVAVAQEILHEKLSAIYPDPENGRIFLTGHSHIDTAWLWPLRETVRKCGRTFSTACRMMEKYPDYHFSCSQPQLYAYTKKYFPTVYDEMKHWIKAGRWETTGGMWVETDCNVPSGESLIRQILHGIKFFREEFGKRPHICWLPDVFGYPAGLPGILRGCGIDWFYTNKLHWQARNRFPYNLFHWVGIDGSSVIAHVPLHNDYYNGNCSPEQITSSWKNYNEKAVYPEFLYPFGYGDGGGGPTEEHLEYAGRAKKFPGISSASQGLSEDYFRDVEEAEPCLPEWRGELYLETHRGTYTTQSATKRANRKNELLLRDAEIASVMSSCFGRNMDVSVLQEEWENLLCLQFHDILPGSSIGMVYEEALKKHESISKTASRLKMNSLSAIANAIKPADILVFNTLSWSRNDPVEATIPAYSYPIEIVDSRGHTAPVQVIQKDGRNAQIVFSPPEVPSIGYSPFSIRKAMKQVTSGISVKTDRLENKYWIIEINKVGEITRLYDRIAEREVIPAGERGNILQLFQDGPEPEAAWNVHVTFEKRQYDIEGKSSIRIAEKGPVRGGLTVLREHRSSRFEQSIMIYDSTPRIDFITKVDWQERQVMLKAAFPVEIMSDEATFEVQFGAVKRPTHTNTSWEQEKFEVPAQRWADISESGYGVSLMNDCKYGYDVRENVLRITLLRGTEWPDPDADRGHQEFTYSLLPHSGGWDEGGTVRKAAELNVPMTCIPGKGVKELPAEAKSIFSVDGKAVLDTIKPAENGQGIILRLYEPHGGRGNVIVTAPSHLESVVSCNHVEENLEEVSCHDNTFSFHIKPFQILSFRIRLVKNDNLTTFMSNL